MTAATRLRAVLALGHERYAPLANRMRAAWQQRTLRERRLLSGAALLLAALLLWQAGLRPAIDTIRDARRQLPVLQAQAAQLHTVIIEAQALGRRRASTLPAGATAQALQAGLHNAGLNEVGHFSAQPNAAADAAQWRISFTRAPAGKVMAWLAGLPAIAQVQVKALELARSTVAGREQPGLLDGDVLLGLPDKAEAS
ncbi:type II secretion system protein GspM [Candidimonas nitroreducens]|nr:type II secretion system protein GspM [Candidimonas nitroreducens]